MPKSNGKRKFNAGGQERRRMSERVEGEKEERPRYSIQQKIQYVEFAMLRMDEDLASLNTIADNIGVSSASLSRWMNKLPQYRDKKLVAGSRSCIIILLRPPRE